MKLIGPYGSLELVLGWMIFAGVCMRNSAWRKYFPLRVTLSVAICIGLQLAANYVGRPILFYYVLLGVLLLCIHLCFQNTVWQTLFVMGIAYALQHLTYSLWLVLSSVFIPGFKFYSTGIWVNVIYYASFLIIIAVAWNITKGFKRFTEIGRFYPPVVIVFLVLIFVSGFLCDQINHFEDWNSIIVARILSSITTALGIWIAIDILVSRKIKMDNTLQQYIIERQKEEFELRKETINDLNIKCHDLKYQIRAIYNRVGRGNTSDLKEIEDCIVAFQSSYKTGNEALNVVLSEKARICAEKGISLNFMGQGELICFMSDIDIYRLFNNAIDNAIEALDKIGPEQRFVGVNISQSGPFISVYFENYYNGQLELSNDMPVTSKENKQNHGFGLKSIRAIADSYGAQFSIAHDGEVFTLNLLFPYSQN